MPDPDISLAGESLTFVATEGNEGVIFVLTTHKIVVLLDNVLVEVLHSNRQIGEFVLVVERRHSRHRISIISQQEQQSTD